MNKPHIKKYFNKVLGVWLWMCVSSGHIQRDVDAWRYVHKTNKPIWDKINAS